MPETIRATNERLRSRPRRGGYLAAFVIANLGNTLTPPSAGAQGLSVFLDSLREAAALSHQQIATLTLTVGLIGFAVVATVMLVRARKSAADAETTSHHEIVTLNAEIDELKALLLSEPQVLVAWAAGADEPEIFGDTGLIISGPAPQRMLSFGSWLEAATAQRLEQSVAKLRGEGRAFVMTLTTRAGRPIEAEGRAVGGRAILRLRDVSGIERELVDLAARHSRLTGDLETMKALLDLMPAPAWARGDDGRLIFVNAAYARAVDAKDSMEAVAREMELLDRSVRGNLSRVRQTGKPYMARLPAIAAGSRRMFDVVDAPTANGSAGIAIDASEVELMRAELARMIEAHRRVLDQLATGVAIFNAERKLIFYNTAFRAMFELDTGFLDQTPSDFNRARRLARQPQAARGAGLPAMATATARGLSRGRTGGASLAFAGRAHAARGHRAQSGRRHHVSL